MDTWAAFMDFRDKVLKALEEARNSKLIGKSLEAKLTVYPKQQVREMLKALDADIAQLLIVSPDYFEVMEADVQVQIMLWYLMMLLLQWKSRRRNVRSLSSSS